MQVGPYAVIDADVEIGDDTVVDSFVHLKRFTRIGAQSRIHSHVSIGDLPQDRAYADCESRCRIGSRTIVREGVTIHRGTAAGSETVVGDDCLLMVNTHVAHNCVLGDGVTLVNGALLGGYVQVGSRAIISGNAAIHQGVRIGELAMVSILARVSRDVPPFVTTDRDGRCAGLNVVGLRRAGVNSAERDELKQAYRILFRSAVGLPEAAGLLSRFHRNRWVEQLLEFVQAPTGRGIGRSRPSVSIDTDIRAAA